MNDSALLIGLRDQDPEAVRSLTRSYLPSIWRFVYSRVKGDDHLAEDIVSETVVALIRAAKDETEIKNPGAWMRSVAHNKVMDHYRSATRARELVQNYTNNNTLTEEDDATSLQLAQENIEEVREVMDSLPEQSRLALEWKYLDRLSVREISERLETTEKAAESILFRARREFREQHEIIQKRQDSPQLIAEPQNQAASTAQPRPPDPPEAIVEFRGNRRPTNLKDSIFLT